MSQEQRERFELEDIGWTPVLEHRIDTQLGIREELIRFCRVLSQTAPEDIPAAFDAAAQRLMDTAYQTPAHLTGGVPELWGAGELAEFFGVAYDRARKIPDTAPGFPDPVARLKGGKIWLADDVRKFAKGWNRRPGPPPRKQGEETGT